jgi:Na+/proline symporter
MENVRSEIESLLDRRWFDFSENISGSINKDGSFEISPKWTIGNIGTSHSGYLSGQMIQNNDKTIIKTIARPGYSVIAIFYFMLFFSATKFFELITNPNDELILWFVILPLTCFALAFAMIFGAKRIRSRFERLMQLRPE